MMISDFPVESGATTRVGRFSAVLDVACPRSLALGLEQPGRCLAGCQSGGPAGVHGHLNHEAAGARQPEVARLFVLRERSALVAMAVRDN